MKITNKEAVEMLNVLTAMGDKNLPRKLSFAIVKNVNMIESQIYKPYFSEFQKIDEKYAVIDKDGKQKKDEKGNLIYKNRKEYEKELEELFSCENEIEFHNIDEALLDQCDENEKFSPLSVMECKILMKMLN